MTNYKEKQKEALNCVTINGKEVPRHKLCHKPTPVKMEVLKNGVPTEQLVLRTQKAAYVVDPVTGCHLRINGKVNGKQAKKERQRLRNLEVTSEQG